MTQASVAYQQLKQQLKLRLTELLQLDEVGRADRVVPDHEMLRGQLRQLLHDSATRPSRLEGLTPAEESQLIDEVAAELSGMGPIGPLMNDPSVSEIMVIGPTKVFVERDGRLERTPIRFRDTDHLRHWIE